MVERSIVFVEFGELGTVQQDRVNYLRQQGRHPRVYRRAVRAENKTREVLVVVADSTKEGA